jgi:hypothetical protein
LVATRTTSILFSVYPMNVVLRNLETYLLEPRQEYIPGWCVRPGTFRVAAPYDRKEPQVSGHRKKQKKEKKSKDDTGSELEKELARWISSQLRALLSRLRARRLVEAMKIDSFYGTYVNTAANEESSLDFVQLQPMLQMLKSGFSCAVELDYDEIYLNGSFQTLDVGDVYETLVVNDHPTPSVINILSGMRPKYLIPPKSAFVMSDLGRIQGLVSVGIAGGLCLKKPSS